MVKIENGLLGFARKETGNKLENTNTALDNYHSTPGLDIFYALVSHKNENLKMHKEGEE